VNTTIAKLDESAATANEVVADPEPTAKEMQPKTIAQAITTENTSKTPIPAEVEALPDVDLKLIPKLDGRTPSKYQMAVFKFIKYGKGNCLVDAVSGSGKSSTIEMAFDLLSPEDKMNTRFLAFNKHIETELSSRGLPAKTMHAEGFAAWRSFAGKVQVDNYKVLNLISERLSPKDMSMKFALSDLVQKAKIHGLVPGNKNGIMEDTPENWIHLMQNFNIDFSEDFDDDTIIENARAILTESNKHHDVVDFADMIYLPLINNIKMPQYKFLFCDECLPYQTPILMADGSSLPIGQIVDEHITGKVITYNTETGEQETKKITKWSKTLNRKPLVRIRVKWRKEYKWIENGRERIGHNNKTNILVCTTDHKVWANEEWIEAGLVNPGMKMQVESLAATTQAFKIGAEGKKKLSEIMSSKNETPEFQERSNWRGTITENIRGGNGTGLTIPQQVLLDELGEGWIAEYAIPTKVKKGLGYPTAYKVDIANPDRMIAIEVDGGRHNMRKEQDKKKEEFLQSIGWKVYRYSNSFAFSNAEKIAQEMNMCIDGDDCPTEGIVESVEPYTLKDYYVYDLTIEDNHNFYANGILVHNCQDLNSLQHKLLTKMLAPNGRFIGVGDPYQSIYGFSGADTKGISRAVKTFNATEIPLSICYRCPKSVINEYAKPLVRHIEVAPWAIEGVTEEKGVGFKNGDFLPNDMIICRNNAPLVKLTYSLLKDRIPCKMLGRDIGKGIASLIRKLKARTIPELVNKLDTWADHEKAKIKRKHEDASVDHIDDRYESVMTFIDNTKAGTPEGIVAEIETMFAEENTKGIVRLSSVHKCKGLEADNVYILNRDLFDKARGRAKTPDQVQQERNVEYVAYTRPKKKLSFIEVPMQSKGAIRKSIMDKASGNNVVAFKLQSKMLMRRFGCR
jgi:hypothetical protein